MGPDLQRDAAQSYDSVIKVFNADGNIPDDGLQSVIESAAKDAKITRPVLASEVADLGPLREAQRELGIRGR